MGNSFYKLIFCFLIPVLCAETAYGQLSATVTPTGTTCGQNNGSAVVVPSGGTTYTYQWSAGGSTTSTATGLASGNYTVTVYSPVTTLDSVYFTDFGPPAPAWTLNVSSTLLTGVTNQADSNYWVINDGEGGQAVGGCGGAGTDAGNGNYTLYITNPPGANQVYSGCAYDAAFAGSCASGLGPCVVTSLAAVSTSISTLGYSNMTLGFQYMTVGAGTSDELTLYFSTNGGTAWTQLPTPAKTPQGSCPNSAGGDNTAPWTQVVPIALPAACNNQASLLLGFNWVNQEGSAGATDPPAAIDNVTITTSTTVTDSVVKNFTIAASTATPTPTAGPVTQPTCTVTTGSFTITNYNAAYTYTITPNTGVTQTGANVTAPAGSYTITATSAGCTSAASAAVVITAAAGAPAAPTVGAVTQPTCTDADGSFTITNYNAAYTYTITPSTGVTQTGANVTAPAGSYTITAESAGCTSAPSSSVVVNAQPVAPVAPTAGPVTQPTCTVADGSFTITNYNAAYTYTITPNTGVTQTGANVTAPAGSYTITAASGGCSSPASAAVTVNAAPAAPAAPTAGAVTQPTCLNADGSFTITNYNAAYTYTITPNTGVTETGANVTAPAGSYTITATGGGCTSPASSAIVVNAQPVTPAQPATGAVTQPTCAVPEGTFTITNYNAAYTYTITPNTGVTQTGANVTAPAGSYTITASSGGCSSAPSSSVTVTAAAGAPATPTLSAVTQPTCATATGSFTITNYNAAYTYTITPSTGVTQTAGTVTAPSGTYTVTAVSAGCTSAPGGPVTVDPQPTNAPITITATRDTICLGSSDLLTASGGVMGTYTWSGGTLGAATITADSIDITASSAGNYAFTVTVNGCTTTSTFTVVAGPVEANLLSVSEPTCGQNNGTITCNTVSFVSINTYLRSDTVVSSGGGTTLDNAGPGNYTFIVFDSRTGCSDTVSNIILTDTTSIPDFTSVVIDSEQCFGNKKGAIYITVGNCNGGCTFAWSSSATDLTDSAVGLPAGPDTFFVTKGGCTHVDTVINVPGPTAALSDSFFVTPDHCSHDVGKAVAVVYGGSGPYTYAWSAGTASGDSTTGLSGDSSILLTVTDAHGCTVTDSGYVTSTAGPRASIQNSDTVCGTDNTGILIVTPLSNDGPFSYEWSNPGQTTAVDAGLAHGVYTVTVSDPFGCDTVMTGIVPAYLPTGLATVVPGAPILQGETVVITLEPNVPVTSVTWDPYIPGSTNNLVVAFQPTETVTYGVTIVYGNSCVLVDSIQIAVINDSAKWVIPNTFTPNGDGINDLWYLTTYPNLSAFHIWIYDRWGNKVYESTDVQFQWNGLDAFAGNKPFDTGVFAYVIEYTVFGSDKSNQVIGGNISLIR